MDRCVPDTFIYHSESGFIEVVNHNKQVLSSHAKTGQKNINAMFVSINASGRRVLKLINKLECWEIVHKYPVSKRNQS